MDVPRGEFVSGREVVPNRVIEKLRGAGLRVTRPRVAVYMALERLGGHRSVDRVVADLRERGEVISRMTAYNAIRDLERARLVMRADAGPGVALYEVGDAWHHHFVCRRCGEIFDVPCATGVKPCLDLTGFEYASIDEAQVIFRGVCRNCADRQ